MLASAVMASLAAYAIWFAAYEKELIVIDHALYRHWQCVFCFSFWPGLVLGAIEHGFYAPLVALSASTLALLIAKAYDAMDYFARWVSGDAGG